MEVGAPLTLVAAAAAAGGLVAWGAHVALEVVAVDAVQLLHLLHQAAVASHAQRIGLAAGRHLERGAQQRVHSGVQAAQPGLTRQRRQVGAQACRAGEKER